MIENQSLTYSCVLQDDKKKELLWIEISFLKESSPLILSEIKRTLF